MMLDAALYFILVSMIFGAHETSPKVRRFAQAAAAFCAAVLLLLHVMRGG